MLSSLEIKNFRTFSHLVIERLRRVNLIVGKNNVGKTTLLEALRLYGSSWPPGTIPAILIDRDETTSGPNQGIQVVFQSLFHRRKMVEESEILLGPVGEPKAERRITMRLQKPTDAAGIEELNPHTTTTTPPPSLSGGRVFLETRDSTKVSRVFEDDALKSAESLNAISEILEPAYLPPRSLFASDMAKWWDAVSLRDAEGRIVEVMQCIAPIERISFVADPSIPGGRMPTVRAAGIEEPVPMRSMGDGVVRMFQIALTHEYAAIRVKQEPDDEFLTSLDAGFLLLDEVENGIHHSVLPKLWKFIFHLAQLHNVQVFATTHSQDCLRGFAEAVAEDEEADGQVVRLERDADEEATRAIVVSREKLPIVVRDSIEVR